MISNFEERLLCGLAIVKENLQFDHLDNFLSIGIKDLQGFVSQKMVMYTVFSVL